MKLGYGLITCQRHPADSRTSTELYSEAIQLAKAAEDAGLDSVWTSEHHFWDDEYMPSLLILSAAIAAATERIQIGTGILLAPLYHPIRLAEDAATVDLISKGRLILGLGIGWRAEEFDRLGIPMEGLGRRLSETVRLLRKAWGPGVFTFKGKVFEFEATNVTPKPEGKIPIWLGGFVDNALRRAGRIADGYLASAPELYDMPRRLDLVREGLAIPGRDEKEFTVAVHKPVWISNDMESELERALELQHNIRWKYNDMRTTFGRDTQGPLPAPPPLNEDTRTLMRQMMILGSPDEVAKSIQSFRDVVGDNLHFVARLYTPGVPLDEALRHIALLGEVKKLLA
ncbi:MAG TPA: LLM class flavin-dependent oxidoreductase [Actinomycetota bacterium]|nr:LLM class flavin-dependent oxidoreductase [Actinomycetota bacterium]